ncbi:ABC transporter permease [Paenibacillus sepulcri]|uniref:ABC transporter permease n=1 Tax=Paenibacillus sepulcri TaxID=359917 RepID=A0ABS7CCQ6_9BACL|nr:ABC transporter permease [Paenibacillus sepulcri]
MNTLSIALKEIKRDFRDRRTLFFMLAFPIVLMLILGMALTNAFTSNASIGSMKVLVKDTSSGMLSQSFQAFAKEIGSTGVQFETAKADIDGREEVAENRYQGYVELTDSGISLYGSDRSALEGNIVQGMLSAFTDKYNAAAAVEKSDPDKIGLVFAGSGGGYIQETSIIADRKAGSMDYYALAMTVMIALWSAMSAGELIRSEIKRGTVARLVAAPVSRSEIFIGKIMGNIVINMLCVVIIVFFSKFAFKAYWGDHLGLVLLVLLTEVVMAASFGLAASYLLKGTSSRGLVNLLVQLFSFFGGAYFPVDDVGGGIMSFVTELSPIRWANRGLTEIIYSNNLSAAWPVMGLNLGLAVLFLVISATIMKRREGL